MAHAHMQAGAPGPQLLATSTGAAVQACTEVARQQSWHKILKPMHIVPVVKPCSLRTPGPGSVQHVLLTESRNFKKLGAFLLSFTGKHP
jgi:hypothetical protein